ncbi:MAG: hypothetical protein HY002_00185 [Candidatus Rokubacteria bacterium]|nr:hypothetical protein [Candidatus Rokubacteria bacterium]
MRGLQGLEEFTLSALELLGGAAEARTSGLYTVLWPVAGSEHLETRQLAFDPELIDEQPEAELVTFGSPVLEELVDRATASGRVAQAFLNAAASASRTTADRLMRSYRFQESAWTAEGGRPWWLPAGVFLFRVRYLSDEREEDLVRVAVSLADGRLLRRLDAALDRHGIAADPAEAWPMMAEWPIGDAYAVARGALEQKLIAPLGLRRRELAARLARESGRAAAYYDELIREREEQRGTLPPGTPERAQVESRLLTLRLERASRLGELRSKYRLEAEVSLRSLLRLYLPRVVFGGRLANKRGEAALSLVWDPIEQIGEPAPCAQCRDLTYELGLYRSGAVACPHCLEAPARPSSRI